MKPIRICRVHNRSSLDYPDSFGVVDGWCAVGAADIRDTVESRLPCRPVAMVWSGDGHALLEVVECDGINHDFDGIALNAQPCERHRECNGGWQYAAEVSERAVFVEPAPGATLNDRWVPEFVKELVAVVPVKPLDKEG